MGSDAKLSTNADLSSGRFDRDRDPNIHRRGDRPAGLHGGKEAPFLQRLQERAVEGRFRGRLHELDLGRAIRADAEPRDGDQIDLAAAQLVRNFRQRLIKGAGAGLGGVGAAAAVAATA
jgi:hypothetical protein